MEISKLLKIPKALTEIPQPPNDIWILGELPSEDCVYLCVVGSRRFTSYGKDACEKIISGLKGYPIVIVSGFAVGIDTIAHKAAIKAGLRTIVFPGSGLSKRAIYPKTNVPLIKEIINNRGCLLSEFEPDFLATQWAFPARNRLMAGISRAVLIIEAEEKSGTLITARLATEYNREVLAVPGSIFANTCKGTNRLIRQGATPVTSSKDVLEALGLEVKDKANSSKDKDIDDLSREEKMVISLLEEPLSRDELIRALKMPASSASVILSVMELKDLIKEEFGEIRLIR